MHPLMDDFYKLLTKLHQDMEKAIIGLSVEALNWIPGVEMNSMCVLVVHTCEAERFWIGEMGGGDPADRNRDTEFRAKDYDETALRQLLNQTLDHSRRTLAVLTPDDFQNQRESPEHHRMFTVGWSILHTLEHTALHLGHVQMTRQLWDQRQTS